MEFFQNNQAIILVIVITLILIAVYSFISKKRRQKQENEMNKFTTYSSTSKVKEPQIKTENKSNYKFSLETGEEINKSGAADVFSYLDGNSEEDTLHKIEEGLNAKNFSESQKKEFMEKVKIVFAQKPEEKEEDLETKIKAIESSNLSEAQKSKMIAFLKENG